MVSVPIKDMMDQKLRLKGDHHHISSPPSDSWAWRKYGQKPIKGSPYPRGYYKCSSSKGCPARKQVERNKLDPNMLLVTYSCEHNHPSPESRNNHHRDAAAGASAAASITTSISGGESSEEEENKLIANNSNNNIGELGSVVNYEFGFFSDFESKPCTMLEYPILADQDINTNDEMAMIFTTMIDEDDSLIYSGLGELPECATVFQWRDSGIAVDWPPPVVEAVCKP
ncbi:probable WRKY transcription factor 69 [Phtheirospermum japonicum]|uniref:Probable WRKY transcription factor 69 n=1 Tax=Phtheirospermum japonicum TaxID=374723 RepID=A0A830CIF2_9LAMI|nr:probable WRKY transcription factor 69 [Phtheirospermum japonicum]